MCIRLVDYDPFEGHFVVIQVLLVNWFVLFCVLKERQAFVFLIGCTVSEHILCFFWSSS